LADDPTHAAPGEGKDATAMVAGVFDDDPAKLVEFVELLFFAYRDFTGDADELLKDLGYGRAHHRVIHFVARHPGLRVADLLDILRITKQSLARVLKQLISEDFVIQESGRTDRRERHLYLTQKGRNFAQELSRLQCARIANALRTIGPVGTEHVEAFLVAMISAPDREAVAELFRKAAAGVDAGKSG
jgi:DNA-binding MarR family transcriptional regulator